MRFEVTSDDPILSITDGSQTEADERSSTFATEEKLLELVGAWPMKRLIAIWNNLPGVSPVRKFTSRQVGIDRIWKGIQNLAPEKGAQAPSVVTKRARAAKGYNPEFGSTSGQ
jgi:hypothetical protein